MELAVLLIVIGYPLLFVAGVLCHKYVVSEAQSIKAHVTAEIHEVRGEVASLPDKLKAKL